MYSCQTSSCAIAISKAEFPVAINCPVCQAELSEVVEFLSHEDLVLIASLPYLIAYPLQQTLLEKHPWTKINLFKDTFLNYLKYLGLLSASEFFNSDIKDKGMVLLFQQNLIETAFGKWNHYIRETLKFLKEQNHTFFCPELATYFELVETGSKSKKYKGEIEFIDANGDIQLKNQVATSIGMLINFRNRYLGHGLTLDSNKSEELWKEYFPMFRYLLEQLSFTKDYPMLKREIGINYLLHSAEITSIDSNSVSSSSIWIQNKKGESFDILPFFIVPGEVSLEKEDKEQMLTYESYTGKTIKFFSPEGTEKQTSGKLLEKLNLLLRDKQKEVPFTPEEFTKEEFLNRITDENKLLLETLINEKKIIPGVYQHREEMEINLREWIGARANIFFIAAEAGSGKTNLLAEMQKQYAERELSSLFIRAGRMEKQSLKEQIAYLLNIDLGQGLQNYSSLAGTQAEPTFILIDGLNEANHSEAIWQEILSLSVIFETGSLKFVVTNRANTKADLDRYLVSDKDQELLYGENKNNEKGLGAYSYWLTALDMKEMKGAWKNYVAKDKARFKPQFTFDAIAEFDRGIYNQINNPLILRLFLEIYNGKALPKKGNKHLHIWSDWFKTFSEAEQTFFTLLANAVWQKGENELLLDDLLNNNVLKPYFTSDIINTPYARLKNMGWISCYTRDLNSYVGFTVEGSLLYLLGVKLQNQTANINLEYIQNILKTNNKLHIASIEAFLGEEALIGNLELVSELIDIEKQDISICLTPLVLFLKTYGVKTTIKKVLENPTERDWEALLKLDEQLEDLQLHVLRIEFLSVVSTFNLLKYKDSLLLGFKFLKFLNNEESVNYFSEIDLSNPFFELPELLEILGNYYTKIGKYDNALSNYTKCLNLLLDNIEINKVNIAKNYKNISRTYRLNGDLKSSFLFLDKCLKLEFEIYNQENLAIASTYLNFGLLWSTRDNLDLALDFYNKSLIIREKKLGENHKFVATILNNIAVIFDKKGDVKEALNYINRSLNINLKYHKNDDYELATTYNNLGDGYSQLGIFKDSIINLEKSLKIRIKHLGINHPDVAQSYYNIGKCYFRNNDYEKAIDYYEKALKIQQERYSKYHINIGRTYHRLAEVNEIIGQYSDSLNYYLKSAEIRNDIFGLDNDITQKAIANAKRLAKELDKESELPEWMN